MKTRTFTTTAFAVVLTAGVAFGQESAQPSAQPSQSGVSAGAASQPSTAGEKIAQAAAQFKDDKTFVQEELLKQRILSNILQTAQDKAQSEKVKEFAKTALKERMQAGDKLKEVAKELKIEALEDDSQQARAIPRIVALKQLQSRLQSASGPQFDRAFLSDVLSMHQDEISQFQAASSEAKQEMVKQFVQNNLPQIQQRLQEAKAAYQEVTGTAWTPSQRGFTPTATYETQPGASSTQPAPGMSGQQPSPGASSPSSSSSPGQSQQ